MVYPLDIHFTVGRFSVDATIKATSYSWIYKDSKGCGFGYSDHRNTISVEDLVKEIMSYLRFETTM